MMTITAVTILLDRIEGRSFDHPAPAGEIFDAGMERMVAGRPGILKRMLAHMTGRFRGTTPHAEPETMSHIPNVPVSGLRVTSRISDLPSPTAGPEQARKQPAHGHGTATVYPPKVPPRQRAAVAAKAEKAA